MAINHSNFGPLNSRYVVRIQDTLCKALSEYPRTLVLRIDLRLPDNNLTHEYSLDSTLITRFIVSLKAQIDADLLRKKNNGKRTFPCRVRYVWAREFGQRGKKHYHLALFLNKDAYAYLGNYIPTDKGYPHNLGVMIMEAWVRVLNLHDDDDYQKYYPLVHFPKPSYAHLNKTSTHFNNDSAEVINRVCYLAKEYSKDSSDKQRNFGCSQY